MQRASRPSSSCFFFFVASLNIKQLTDGEFVASPAFQVMMKRCSADGERQRGVVNANRAEGKSREAVSLWVHLNFLRLVSQSARLKVKQWGDPFSVPVADSSRLTQSDQAPRGPRSRCRGGKLLCSPEKHFHLISKETSAELLTGRQQLQTRPIRFYICDVNHNVKSAVCSTGDARKLVRQLSLVWTAAIFPSGIWFIYMNLCSRRAESSWRGSVYTAASRHGPLDWTGLEELQ